MAGPVRPELLVIEDDQSFASALVRLFRGTFSAIPAHTAEAAFREIHDPRRFSGIIVDIVLPDRSGLETLREIRERGVVCPILVLTAVFDRGLAASVQLHGAEYLPKPPDPDHLFAFARRVTAFARTDHDRVRRVIEAFALKHKLTARETEVVALGVSNLPRAQIAERMGIKEATLKTNIRALLRKSRAKTFSELLAALQQEIRREP
jgi:FixJ family two-component response regulator